MIDSHAHVNISPLFQRPKEVIQSSLDAGLTAIINVGVDIPTSRRSIELSDVFPIAWASCGIHPNTVVPKDEIPDSLDALEHLLKHPKVVALGEIGLDFYRDRVPAQDQEFLFRKQLELALWVKKPVIIHLRNSYERFREIFIDYPDIRGVCHAYSGDAEFSKWLLKETKLYIGLGGPITFKNYKNQDIINLFPPQRILLETDCPYLTPHPHRGGVNEPKYIPLILEKLSEIMDVPEKELDWIIPKNCSQLFGIGLPQRGASRVFIHDNNMMDKIASFSSISESALEIGAGPGTLTSRLKTRYSQLFAVEPDISVYPNFDDVTLIQKSILDVNLTEISEFIGHKLDIWGNIPYHITSPILELLDRNIESIDQAYLLVQTEVANRLSAKVGNKDYGIPTVLLGNRWFIKKILNVPRSCFKPVPDVDSALIHLVPRKKTLVPDSELFQKLVRKSFGQRRKMLRKSLKEFLPKTMSFDYLTKRPEQLSIDDFGKLAELIDK